MYHRYKTPFFEWWTPEQNQCSRCGSWEGRLADDISRLCHACFDAEDFMFNWSLRHRHSAFRNGSDYFPDGCCAICQRRMTKYQLRLPGQTHGPCCRRCGLKIAKSIRRYLVKRDAEQRFYEKRRQEEERWLFVAGVRLRMARKLLRERNRRVRHV